MRPVVQGFCGSSIVWRVAVTHQWLEALGVTHRRIYILLEIIEIPTNQTRSWAAGEWDSFLLIQSPCYAVCLQWIHSKMERSHFLEFFDVQQLRRFCIDLLRFDRDNLYGCTGLNRLIETLRNFIPFISAAEWEYASVWIPYCDCRDYRLFGQNFFNCLFALCHKVQNWKRCAGHGVCIATYREGDGTVDVEICEPVHTVVKFQLSHIVGKSGGVIRWIGNSVLDCFVHQIVECNSDHLSLKIEEAEKIPGHKVATVGRVCRKNHLLALFKQVLDDSELWVGHVATWGVLGRCMSEREALREDWERLVREPEVASHAGCWKFHHVTIGPCDEVFLVGIVAIILEVCAESVRDCACDTCGLCDYGNHSSMYF